MRYFSAYFISILVLTLTACGASGSIQVEKYTGIIEPAGITSYQYGTHTLKTENTFYALKSDNIQLDDHTGKKLILKAEKIEGYPLEGGPLYLNVLKIIE